MAVRKAEWAARTKASTTVATTPAGLAAQLLLTVNFIGQIEPWTDPDSAEAIEQGQWNWRDDLDRKALVSLLTGARALSQA